MHYFQIGIKAVAEPSEPLGKEQQETYELLKRIQRRSYSLQELLILSGLRSPLPFWNRLHRLEQKGLIAIVDTTAIHNPGLLV